MYNVHILSKGYSEFHPTYCRANGTSTLVKGTRHNVVVDTMTPWDKDILGKKVNIALLIINYLFYLIVSGLKKHDLRPEDIDVLVCTHGHSDHVGNNNLFLNAVHIVGWCVSKKDEYDLSPYFESEKGYEIDGDNLRVFPTPGHTADSVSVRVQTSNGIIVVAGDTFERENDEEIWEKVAVSENPEKQRESRKKIWKMADYIIPGHGDIFKVPK